MKSVSNSIEIKGIVRNKTKIGVQDGQCDDLVNLKFKDGSWRVSADGKLITNKAGTAFNISPYTQLYVHTNVYHHLLGVTNNKLWWFANIDTDNETFSYITDEEGDPEPIEICDVEGDVTIVQNGHLLTIISGAGSMTSYSIYKTANYKKIVAGNNDMNYSRNLYPYGNVSFNSISLADEDYSISRKEFGEQTFLTAYEAVPYVIDKLAEKGLVGMPMLAVVAAKDYDGNYIFTSNPQYIFPKEKLYNLQQENKCVVCLHKYANQSYEGKNLYELNSVGICDFSNAPINDGVRVVNLDDNPSFLTTLSSLTPPIGELNCVNLLGNPDWSVIDRYWYGSKLTLSIENYDFIRDNSDVIKSLCVFVTRQVNIFPTSYDDLSECSTHYDNEKIRIDKTIDGYLDPTYVTCRNIRDKKYIINELLNCPFYLLREYNKEEIQKLKYNPIIDLTTDVKYKDILKPSVLINQDVLNSESFSRQNYMPKVIFQYNNRLHMANYTAQQFHGYPIDCFQLSNHNVNVEEGSYAIGGVLPNLKEFDDCQHPRAIYKFLSNSSNETCNEYIQSAKSKGYCFAFIRVLLDLQDSQQQVVRYISPYEAYNFENGDKANFIESLGALLTFPDNRAKEMEVAVISLHEGKVYRRSKTFTLTPHQYLNIAYYIDQQLKPIDLPLVEPTSGVKLEDFIADSQKHLFITPNEMNNSEDFPNGLKVSAVNSPFFFPYETTYQVGSSEIVALMSNAVAIGTGQTGAAPLYVFCKDGVYALMVDSTGEMAYSNARIIARDVCNNAKSVTPIDNGVVFTTDRGLMSIAGNEVIELGASAEGDVFDITDTHDKAKKIMFNAFRMDKLGSLPSELLDNVDFLAYIKGAIINYDHNDRELMVSNPEYNYTYIMDRDGRWSRRDYHAVEYVNNYPTSYRVTKEGKLYKVDVEDNVRGKYYLLSNVIKLDSISFKQAYRLVVRGYFESNAFEQQIMPRGFDIEQGGAVSKIYSTIGCYVFGSYDGRQWSLIGYNERSGNFTDLGCNTAHTDVKYLRLCVAGNVTKNTRIDFIEISADGSVLNTKLR
jgi:hypothetical protein